MGIHKFDSFEHGKYIQEYFVRNAIFYGTISAHIKQYIKPNMAGIDIGAGPGVGARILAALNIPTLLTGYEPSKTNNDGIELAKELQATQTHYVALQKGVNDIIIKPNTVDYIFILRASHEIKESLGGTKQFFTKLTELLSMLKKDGILIIADPQYLDENPSEALIKKIQEYQMAHAKHCHIPSDYVQNTELISHCTQHGMKLLKEDILGNPKLLDFLNENGFNLDKDPHGFYVQSWKK